MSHRLIDDYYQGENNAEVNYSYTSETDPIAVSVSNEILERSANGIKKYGTTLERTDLSLLQWLQHAKEEALDLALYLERIKQEITSTPDN